MRSGWLLAVVVMAGCVQSASVVCGDGTVCPEGATCDVALGRCITEAQTQACAALAEGAGCSVVGVPGECRGGACEPLVCGDGRATGAEACDGDDLAGATCASLGFSGETTGLRCNELCRLETAGCTGICGDGVLDGSELCDGANPDGVTCADVGFYREVTPGPLTCNGVCGWATSGCADYCGDGITNGPELCDGAPPVETCVDLGFDAGRAACSGICGADLGPCARFGFRAESITSSYLSSFHASRPDDQWAVGVGGVAAHRTTSGWAVVPTPTTQALLGVWSVSPARAWAIGVPASESAAPPVMRWDGVSWTLLAATPVIDPTAVWGTDAEVFVGTTAGVWTWSAAGWSPVGTLAGAVSSIGGTSATDLWATLPGGIHHWDGTAWTLSSPLATGRLLARAADEVYAVGTNAVLHWDGLTWTSIGAPFQPSVLAASAANDVWASAPGRVWHFDGQRWMAAAGRINTTSEVGLVSFGVDRVVSATTDGLGYLYRGQALGPASIPPFVAPTQLWSDGNGAYVILATTRILVDTGVGWQTTQLRPSAAAPLSTLRDAWGLSSAAIWAGGLDGNLYRFDGSAWSWETGFDGGIDALGGTSASDRWVFGTFGAYHFDGVAWTNRPASPAVAFQNAEVADGEVWVATNAGAFLRWDGAAWQPMGNVPPGEEVTDLEVVGPANVYVAIGRRSILHFDGATWRSVALPTVGEVTRLDSTAADDVFAITATQVFHFDGGAWAEVRGPAPLRDVVAHPHAVDFLVARVTTAEVQGLLRTRPWACRATETACSDGVDDDCDGVLDALDSDCP